MFSPLLGCRRHQSVCRVSLRTTDLMLLLLLLLVLLGIHASGIAASTVSWNVVWRAISATTTKTYN